MFYEAVPQSTLGILEDLSNYQYISENFYLAGGTGLALYLGHRISNDLDFFTEQDINHYELELIFDKEKSPKIYQSKNSIWYKFENIEISFFKYPYRCIEDFQKIFNIRLASKKDIYAMKTMDLIQRVAKKDFYDIYEFFNEYTIKEIKEILITKFDFNNVNFYQLVKAINYFDDAEMNPDVESLKSVEWDKIKNFFINHFDNFYNQFIEKQ